MSSSCSFQVDFVSTEWGNVLVAVQGEKNKPAIVTFHDIGLNRKSVGFVDILCFVLELIRCHSEPPSIHLYF